MQFYNTYCVKNFKLDCNYYKYDYSKLNTT